MGAVAWGQWPTPRFPSPLIEPDVRSYRIRLSDWLHRRPTTRHIRAGVQDAERRVLRKQPRKRTGEFRALPLCAVARGSRARARRCSGQRCGTLTGASRSESSSTSRAECSWMTRQRISGVHVIDVHGRMPSGLVPARDRTASPLTAFVTSERPSPISLSSRSLIDQRWAIAACLMRQVM
jgi:hypothetical protein